LSSAPFDTPSGRSSTKRGIHSVMPDCGSGTPYTPPDWLRLTAPQVPGGVSPSAECRRSRSRVHMAFWPHSVGPVSTRSSRCLSGDESTGHHQIQLLKSHSFGSRLRISAFGIGRRFSSMASRMNRLRRYSTGRCDEFDKKTVLSFVAHFTIPSTSLQSRRDMEKGTSKSERIPPFTIRNLASSVSSHASYSSNPPLPIANAPLLAHANCAYCFQSIFTH
jgi:hypothetical protein